MNTILIIIFVLFPTHELENNGRGCENDDNFIDFNEAQYYSAPSNYKYTRNPDMKAERI